MAGQGRYKGCLLFSQLLQYFRVCAKQCHQPLERVKVTIGVRIVQTGGRRMRPAVAYGLCFLKLVAGGDWPSKRLRKFTPVFVDEPQ